MSFYHAEQICTRVTGPFLHYIEHAHLIFELFGHFESHPLHSQSEYGRRLLLCNGINPFLAHYLIFLLFSRLFFFFFFFLVFHFSRDESGPTTLAKLKAQVSALATQSQLLHAQQQAEQPTHAFHELVCWYEICELAPSGEVSMVFFFLCNSTFL